LRRSFGQGFDATIVKISDEPDDLMTRGRALRKETKSDALHLAADEESSRYPVVH
jgi:hypothetical protein